MKSTFVPIDTGDPETNRRINIQAALADEGDPVWWWLSFCDPDLAPGSQFLGVAIVSAPNGGAAVSRAWGMGINPGGQVMMIGPLEGERIPPEQYRNRLLDKNAAAGLVLLMEGGPSPEDEGLYRCTQCEFMFQVALGRCPRCACEISVTVCQVG